MNHAIHDNHTHEHGPNCGHVAIQHGDHVGYLHDGHLHCPHDGHYDEHSIAASDANPNSCAPHECSAHDSDHIHGPDCGHPAVPHDDHIDYLVDGHLHHPHGEHCDDHGPLSLA